MEVLGLILMVLALLLSLAFLTYNPADDPIARQIHLGEALVDPGANQAQFRVRNALGLVGAELARLLVPGFLGYTVLLLTGVLGVWGYAVFRHLELRPYAYVSGLVVLSSFFLACLIGWFGHVLDTDLVRWAGAVGMGVAGWMQRVVGTTGSLILLLLSITVMLLLVVDHDIQRSIDRVVEVVRSTRERLSAWWTAFLDRRAARHEERTEARRRAREARKERQRETEAAGSPTPQETPDDPTAADAAEPTSASAPASRSAPSAESEPSSSSEPRSSETQAEGRQAAETEDAGPDASPSLSPTSGDASPVRRNDLFRNRIRDVADSSEPSSASSPPSDEATESDASSDEPASPQTHELDMSSLEDEFSHAFDEADLQEEDDRDPAASSSDDRSAPDRKDAADSAPSPSGEPDDPENTDEADSPSSPPDEDDLELTVKEQVKEEKADEIERASETPEEVEYESPSLELLDEPADDDPSVDMEELEANKRILLDKLQTYNIEIQEINAVVGPTVTRYEMIPAPGIKVSRIKSLEDDLAMAMAAQGVRMIAPIPGKSAVGVEIANRNRELVRLRDVIGTAKFRDTDMELPIPLGKTIEGEVFLADLTKMPHLLIAGATGSGKSVGLNALITGLIYACHPGNLKFVIIDPKKIELQQYTHLRSHFMAQPEDLDEAVITDVDEALGVLKSCEKEMEERYDLLSEASVRGVRQYNRKFKDGELDPRDGHRHMPYIVVVVDEMADLMMQTDKDVEGPIARLAQKARAVGIHLVLATQRPSVDVITGLIKANFPSRIAYEVASRVDSRTILDQIGAEGLVGNGDMLYLSGSHLRRIQGPFVSVEEVERVVDFIADQGEIGTYTLPSLTDAGHGPDSTLGVEDTDDKFEEGARVIVRRQQGSVSLLQRKLAVGYTRAARIVDQLEEAGIVGPFNGTKAREVLVDSEDELERLLSGDDDAEESPETD